MNDAFDFKMIEVGELRVEARSIFLRATLLKAMNIMQSTNKSTDGEASGDVRLRLEAEDSVATSQVFADDVRIRQVQ